MLGNGAELLLDRWGGDLRRLRDEAGGDAKRISALLQEFPGIGPSGADIFLREVQAVWPAVAPYLDDRVLKGARRIGLPGDAEALAGLVGPGKDLARLAAGLVRVSLSKTAAEQVKEAAG